MSLPKVKGLSSEQSEAMVRLSRLPAFSDLVNKVEADEVSVIAPSSAVTLRSDQQLAWDISPHFCS